MPKFQPFKIINLTTTHPQHYGHSTSTIVKISCEDHGGSKFKYHGGNFTQAMTKVQAKD